MFSRPIYLCSLLNLRIIISKCKVLSHSKGDVLLARRSRRAVQVLTILGEVNEKWHVVLGQAGGEDRLEKDDYILLTFV